MIFVDCVDTPVTIRVFFGAKENFSLIVLGGCQEALLAFLGGQHRLESNNSGHWEGISSACRGGKQAGEDEVFKHLFFN